MPNTNNTSRCTCKRAGTCDTCRIAATASQQGQISADAYDGKGPRRPHRMVTRERDW